MAALVDLLAVMLLHVYAVMLIVLRARLYSARLYRPMLVNVALSFVPVVGALAAVAGLLFLAPTLTALADQLDAAVPVILWSYLVVATLLWLLLGRASSWRRSHSMTSSSATSPHTTPPAPHDCLPRPYETEACRSTATFDRKSR